MSKARDLANLLADGSVGTNELADGAVTEAKIGTGAVTANKLAAGAAVPSQSGQSGKFLTTDGSNASWATVNTDLVSDTTPQLGGNLDAQSNQIVSVSRIGIGTGNPSGGLTLFGGGYGNQGKLFVYGGGDENNFSQSNHEVMRLGRGDIEDSYYHSIWSATGSGGEDNHWLRFYINQGNTSGTAQIKAMEMNGHGHITTPYQPSFRAWTSTDYTSNGVMEGSPGVWTEDHDNNNDFSNGRFTAPVDGVYQFHVQWDALNQGSSISLLVNTSDYKVKWEPTMNSSGWECYAYSTIIKLSQGDYVRLVGNNSSGGSPFHMGGGHWGYFAGHLIG